MIGISVLILVSFFSDKILTSPTPVTSKHDGVYPFEFAAKEEWRAKPATGFTVLSKPVPVVVIHHTYVPKACWGKQECERAMRSMQQMHQQTKGWADIGYNFAVGSDGVVYEGRGWEAVGAHASGHNAKSIGIALIGDWRDNLPPAEQIKVAQDLISKGVKLGYVQPNYKLVGHRQLGSTECPGNTLYENLKTWEHFTEKAL